MTIAAAQDGAPKARAVPRKRAGLLRRIVRHRADYLYIAPAFAVMLLVIGYPIYDTVYLSFFNTPPSLAMSEKVYVGLDNYERILTSASFREVTINTLVWTVFSTFFAFLLGLGAALALNRSFIGRGLLRGMLLIPYVISAVAASYVWRWLYHSDFGVIGAISVALGITDKPINFLDNVDSALASLIVVNVWKEFPFAMIMLLAGLQTVPDELHRAARVDGAGAWQRFWHITVPHLKGVTLVTVLLLVVTNLNGFTIPWIMTGGGPAGSTDIWITQIYQLAFGRIRFGIASAYSVILFGVMMALGYFYVRALTRGEGRRPE
ncbi:multiple sugar transport system permease protein [Inquilinus ginsengisoli]|uniref:Multiple sugar transport system permease protein n=1 Tax=Inquilinus ginsengisoli TaxID=363840 RepID=A0ABU1JRQ0_9PROT|nr:sugar ABC transporter permease [Inquilinus ginsengisoli]MDR6290993.1 multiple sugar transport system permease protein [Inquilinus ginsengisoli]